MKSLACKSSLGASREHATCTARWFEVHRLLVTRNSGLASGVHRSIASNPAEERRPPGRYPASKRLELCMVTMTWLTFFPTFFGKVAWELMKPPFMYLFHIAITICRELIDSLPGKAFLLVVLSYLAVLKWVFTTGLGIVERVQRRSGKGYSPDQSYNPEASGLHGYGSVTHEAMPLQHGRLIGEVFSTHIFDFDDHDYVRTSEECFHGLEDLGYAVAGAQSGSQPACKAALCQARHMGQMQGSALPGIQRAIVLTPVP